MPSPEPVKPKCSSVVALMLTLRTSVCRQAAIFSRIAAIKGADSVDFALVNRLHAGDIAVTQDYGLAAMCLARGARVLRQDGLEYTQENIDALLLARHTAKKIRRSGGRLHGNKKRSRQEDRDFEQALTAMITGENTHD